MRWAYPQVRLKTSASSVNANTLLVFTYLCQTLIRYRLSKVEPPFKWCVDSDLLRKHNLISPLDYRTIHTPVGKIPKGNISEKETMLKRALFIILLCLSLLTGNPTPGFFQPTVSYNMHICTELQDDGYTELPQPSRTAQSLLDKSEESLTFPSSVELVKGTSSEVRH